MFELGSSLRGASDLIGQGTKPMQKYLAAPVGYHAARMQLVETISIRIPSLR